VSGEFGFVVVRITAAGDEVVSRNISLKLARGAYEAAVKEYVRDKIELRIGSHVTKRNWVIKVVKITLMEPVNEAAKAVPGALLTDQMGEVVAGWEVTEPALRRLLEARGFAFFDVEQLPGTEEWRIVQQVPDRKW
jgi:hypothetical protein